MNTSVSEAADLAALEEKGRVIVDGLWKTYCAMEGHQLSMYHGLTREHGFSLREGTRLKFAPSEFFDVLISIGGYRSGKTFSALVRIINDATQFPGNQILVVRKHHEQLHNTVLKDVKDLMSRVTGGHPEWIVMKEGWNTQGAYELEVATPDPKRPSKIIFKIEPQNATEEAIRDAFKGYECGLIIFEEATQLSAVTFDVLQSRMSAKCFIDPNLPPTPYGQEIKAGELEHFSNLWPGFKPYMLILANPGYEDHWLEVIAARNEKDMARGVRPLYAVVRTTMEDNRKHLPEGYIEKEKARYKDDPIGYQMYILGQTGTRVEGQPVFQAHYQRENHRSSDLRFNPGWPLVIGADWGYQRPRAVFGQLDQEIDAFNALDELCPKQLEAEQFAQQIVDFIKQRFPKAKSILAFGDPSGWQKTDKGDPTIVRVQKVTGFQWVPSNNDLDAGHGELRRLMRDFRRKGEIFRPRFQHSPACSHLELAIRQGYTFDVNSKGQVADKPNPRNPFKDIMDALRYIIMGLYGFAGMVRESRNPWEMAVTGSTSLGESCEALGPERLDTNRPTEDSHNSMFKRG